MDKKEPTIAMHAVKVEEVIGILETDASKGLTDAEVKLRINKYGLNKIVENRNRSLFRIFINQFTSPIVGLLAFAAALSFYFAEIADGIAILAVILINAMIGFYMEFSAQKSMHALKQLSKVPAKVIRNKNLVEIDSVFIVPGDVLFIEAGDMLTADGRLIAQTQLQMDESSLTGESIPIEKVTDVLPDDTTLAERLNMVYKGTFVTKGNAYLVVTATAMRTELGKIAGMVDNADQSATPLEKKLEQFSKRLIWITVGLVIAIFIAGLLNGKKLLEMLETSIALAVAAIPEGLPIVATLALAQGMLKLARYNVIVKKLSAVETLGGTNVICTDKTGTLTQNKIEVETIIVSSKEEEAEQIMHKVAVLCNTAALSKENGVSGEIGDPLEIGLLKYAEENGIDIMHLRQLFPKQAEEPFSSETKMMATLHVNDGKFFVYAKGAAEEVIAKSKRIFSDNGVIDLDEKIKEKWMQRSTQLAEDGLRVIAAAHAVAEKPAKNLTDDLIFVGLFGLLDPPREEVFEALEQCASAGIEVKMITGDHPATAKKIAQELGMGDGNIPLVTGKSMKPLEELTNEDKQHWANAKVFARVNPRQKLDLVTVLQEQGNIVGMTGDGVNDAPAIKKADIGIAMGKRGTQVSQEVSDMVLKDDSFTSIVVAIREGRVIFDNIRKFVVFLLSCNLSELLVIATAAIFNLPFQLFPLQILFINLITDVLPALALGITEGAPDIMERKPMKMTDPIIDRTRWRAIFIYSFVIAGVTVTAVFLEHLLVHQPEDWNPEMGTNVVFFSLIFSQLLHVFNMSSGNKIFFKNEVVQNKYVWWAVGLSVSILLGMYAFESTRTLLALHTMTTVDWIVSISAGLISFFIIHLAKRLTVIH